MSFYYPWAFLVLLVPLALALREWNVLRRRGSTDTRSKIIRAEARRSKLSIHPAAGGKNPRRLRWRLLLGLIFAIVALARPQWGRIEEPVFQQAREIIIALDLSRSMSSTDVKPARLDRAKLLVTSLLGQLKGERVGLIDFAGTAFLQCPLSSDYEILGQFLPQLNPGYMPVEGTDYDALLRTALDAFGRDDGADRFLILLSDGGADPNDWRAHIPELKARGIHVITLGIGTAAGSMIPDDSGGFVKDDRGAVVLSKLDASTMRELASKTGGAYADGSAWVDLPKLIQDTVDQGKRGNFKDVGRIRLAERFQWMLAPALLFFIWSFWREFPVRPKPRSLRLSDAASALVAPLLLTTFLLALARHPLAAQTAADTDSPAAPVTQLVGKLSANPSLTAADYATLARTTLDYGAHLEATGQPVPQGPLNDALAAVAAGRSMNAKAADWTNLQAKLDALLKQKKPPRQKQNQDQQQKQSQKNQSDSSKNGKSGDQKNQDRQNQKPDKNQSSSSRQNSQKNQQGQKNDGSSQSQNSTPQDHQNESQNQNPASQPGSTQNQPSPGDTQPSPSKPQPQPSSPQQQSTNNQPAPSPTPSSSADMQQVGASPQKSAAAPQDPSLAGPLRLLDQVRQSDFPARLFQLMQAQDPNAKPPAHTGQTW